MYNSSQKVIYEDSDFVITEFESQYALNPQRYTFVYEWKNGGFTSGGRHYNEVIAHRRTRPRANKERKACIAILKAQVKRRKSRVDELIREADKLKGEIVRKEKLIEHST